LIKIYKLDNETIILMRTDNILKPFNESMKSAPNFWKFFDKVKHNGFYNKELGNLYNVIESLSALFLLNCIHNDTKKILAEESSRKKGIRIMQNGKIIDNIIRSELFEFKR